MGAIAAIGAVISAQFNSDLNRSLRGRPLSGRGHCRRRASQEPDAAASLPARQAPQSQARSKRQAVDAFHAGIAATGQAVARPLPPMHQAARGICQ